MQEPQQMHQDNDTRSLPSWYQRFRMGPLGPLGLCAIALGFIALLISGRLRMLYPMPRTVVASPQLQLQPQPQPQAQLQPSPRTPPKQVGPGAHLPSKAGEPRPNKPDAPGTATDGFETPSGK